MYEREPEKGEPKLPQQEARICECAVLYGTIMTGLKKKALESGERHGTEGSKDRPCGIAREFPSRTKTPTWMLVVFRRGAARERLKKARSERPSPVTFTGYEKGQDSRVKQSTFQERAEEGGFKKRGRWACGHG